ncbi:RecX family transcriptional regulator [Aerococcus kribbianus]|uniref:Regulatory protein RecX n=1 Tax=Aerococcus kribbianus TaxID=2999064 RepID=A0A9X3JFA4_9LACT|nr:MULTISPECIES: RecX family transcriptional regulator [unclassified Aerococcus]MCZ0718119.1 RecX family transcriptional regulator [Aerococcus sp. YH-aer221]MCZ0726312.1 RecX family transcriptional regulator [Aerococcus sp. YH-aer222]
MAKEPMRLSEIETGKNTKTKQVQPSGNAREINFSKGNKPLLKAESKEVHQAQETGQVTAIAVQKKNKERFNLFVDNRFAIGISESTLVHFALTKGQTIDQNLLEAIKNYEENDQAYQSSLRYLSQQLRSEKEVKDKLISLDYPQVAIEFALERLKKLDLLNDLAYGQAYVRTAMRVNKKGPQVIRRDLKQKGLNQTTIYQALEEYSDRNEEENAYSIAKKYYLKQQGKYSAYHCQQKLQTYLLSKGYSHDLAAQLSRQVSEELADSSQDYQALEKQAHRYWRRYAKLTSKERHYKVKGLLLSKGFEGEAVTQVLKQIEDDSND